MSTTTIFHDLTTAQPHCADDPDDLWAWVRLGDDKGDNVTLILKTREQADALARAALTALDFLTHGGLPAPASGEVSS
jgi:hypothetical protein